VIIHRLRNFDDYRLHVARMESIYSERRRLERDLQKNHSRAFDVPGFSYPAGKPVKFRADFAYSNGTDVNWREWLVCPVTGLNNRLRAAVHLADSELGLLPQVAVEWSCLFREIICIRGQGRLSSLSYIASGTLIAQVKEARFNDAYALAYWSDILRYLGVEQFVFVAVK
jgi:hypothetical protein